MSKSSARTPPKQYVATYSAGEDQNRLASAAKYFGLAKSRLTQRPIRDLGLRQQQQDDRSELPSSLASRFHTVWRNVGILFTDSTLEAAMMHSVGSIAETERVAGDGSLHLLSIARRKKGVEVQYGDLMDLFHQRPLEPKVYEVRETEDEEYEELVMDTVEGGTITAAVFGIVKGMVGPAVLYLPRGFATSGYGVAIPAMLLATSSYLYCSTRLLQCWKIESEKIHLRAEKMEEVQRLLGDINHLYGSVEIESSQSVESQKKIELGPTLLTYPELARRAFGEYAFLISGGIAAMQFGVCLTYLIFVPQNLSESARAFGIDVPKQVLLVAMLVIVIPLSWIRDIRKLTPINIVATIFIMFGLASVIFIALFDSDGLRDTHAVERGLELNLVQEIVRLPALKDTWYLFIGTSFFCFEGSITLLVPLQEAVYKREDRERFSSVNNKVITSIVSFYVIFATICWASFGNSVQTALTASLPRGSLSTMVQVAYSIAVIFTFPLQAFPALEVVTRRHDSKESDGEHKFKRDVTASAIICFLGLVAVIAIDYLGNVVSLLGSLVGIPIALIYPPLMHNILVRGSSKTTRIMNYCLAGVGLCAATASSYTTIVSWDRGVEG